MVHMRVALCAAVALAALLAVPESEAHTLPRSDAVRITKLSARKDYRGAIPFVARCRRRDRHRMLCSFIARWSDASCLASYNLYLPPGRYRVVVSQPLAEMCS